MNTNYKDIDSYIKSMPKEVQSALKQIRQAVHSAVPKAEETIKYQMPTFRLENKNMVHFAGWKNHIGFYPTPSPIKILEKELSKYEQSKGSIHFPLSKPMPLALIKKIAKLRAKQILENL